MQKLILNLSAIFAFLGLIACSRGITEEGNSIAEFDLWDGSNGDLQVNMGNGVSGHWFSVNDGNENGSSLIKFPTIEKENLTSDNIKSIVSYCGGVCGTVELGQASDPSAGVGIALAEENSAIDISGWDGICVSYESELSMEGVIGYENGASDDMPTVVFDKTTSGNAVARCAKWSDFKQKSLEKSGTEASKKASSIIFKFIGKAMQTGYFNIKGVSSYKHGVENLDSIEHVTSSKNVVDACLWNGTSNEPGYIVKSGSDDVAEGKWYSYNDREEGGGSLLHWSAEAPSYKSSFEWLTNDELFVGGLSASVALDMGTSSSAYAGVGFTYSSVPVDLSEWGGICVYYRADKEMRVVLAADSLEADYILDASENPVEKCISWKDFSSSGLEKKASDIKFEVRSNENVYNQIKFNIIAVGKYMTDGACFIDSSKLTNQ
ncbi:hypothetical protein [Fibrobacter sp.]|uniref:hypothetical protein n=1 Tax=Fibrobacter sp. TaxID=35828 RepID=UPI00386C5E0C